MASELNVFDPTGAEAIRVALIDALACSSPAGLCGVCREEAEHALLDKIEAPPDFVLTLRWTSQSCGWTTTIDAPGFAGDGRDHFPDGRTPCGPITAQKAPTTPKEDATR